jgi:hypothetical protein
VSPLSESISLTPQFKGSTSFISLLNLSITLTSSCSSQIKATDSLTFQTLFRTVDDTNRIWHYLQRPSTLGSICGCARLLDHSFGLRDRVEDGYGLAPTDECYCINLNKSMFQQNTSIRGGGISVDCSTEYLRHSCVAGCAYKPHALFFACLCRQK